MTQTPLRRIIYHSTLVWSRVLDVEALNDLLTGARHFNAFNNVTGQLWSDNKTFVQAIEGPEDALEAVMARIRADPTHDHITVIINMPILERGFGDWAMGFQTTEFTDEGPRLAFITDMVDENLTMKGFNLLGWAQQLKVVTNGLATAAIIIAAAWIIYTLLEGL